MEILEKHAVKVSLVPLDVFDGAGGEDAVKASLGAVEAAPEGSELAQIPVGGPEGDAVGEDKLRIAVGLESGNLACEMVFPVGFALGFRDDGIGGEDAVASSVGGG